MSALRGAKKWSESTALAIGVAVVLLIGAYLFPMHTSLGQGIDERLVVGWQAVMVPDTNVQYYRMEFQDGSFLQYPIRGVPTQWFVKRTPDSDLATKLNLVPVAEIAFKQNPRGVEHTLGTWANVPSLFHPFNEEPIAYTPAFLNALQSIGFNPARIGGPNLPPGSLGTTSLTGGVLHIDTQPNGNTIKQCSPGQTPAVL